MPAALFTFKMQRYIDSFWAPKLPGPPRLNNIHLPTEYFLHGYSPIKGTNSFRMSFVQTDLWVEGKRVVCRFFHTLLHSFITMIDWALKKQLSVAPHQTAWWSPGICNFTQKNASYSMRGFCARGHFLLPHHMGSHKLLSQDLSLFPEGGGRCSERCLLWLRIVLTMQRITKL